MCHVSYRTNLTSLYSPENWKYENEQEFIKENQISQCGLFWQTFPIIFTSNQRFFTPRESY